MKVLFVYSELVVERIGNKLYHNFLPDIIDRYSRYGELTVCVSVQDMDKSNSKPINDTGQVKFEFIRKENSLKSLLSTRFENIRILKHQIRRADIVITHVPCSVQDIVAKWCNKFSKSYIGVVVGCPWDSLRHHSLAGKFVAPFSYLSLRKFIINAPYVIYVTDFFLQNRYPTKGISIGCSDVAIPSQTFASNQAERIAFIKKNNHTINLVSVGAVGNPVKGHEDVIKALKTLKSANKNYIYHLIGGGDSSRLKALARKLDVEKNVIFYGQKSHEEIFSILKGMHIYIQPSRTEGLSRAIIEALSVGSPVIATRVGGNSELIISEYLYKPGAILNLVKLIKRLSSPEMQIAYAKLAIDKANQYDKETLENKRNAFIQNVIRRIN